MVAINKITPIYHVPNVARENFARVNERRASQYRIDWKAADGVACNIYISAAMLERATATIQALGGGEITVYAVEGDGSLSWISCIV